MDIARYLSCVSQDTFIIDSLFADAINESTTSKLMKYSVPLEPSLWGGNFPAGVLSALFH